MTKTTREHHLFFIAVERAEVTWKYFLSLSPILLPFLPPPFLFCLLTELRPSHKLSTRSTTMHSPCECLGSFKAFVKSPPCLFDKSTDLFKECLRSGDPLSLIESRRQKRHELFWWVNFNWWLSWFHLGTLSYIWELLICSILCALMGVLVKARPEQAWHGVSIIELMHVTDYGRSRL